MTHSSLWIRRLRIRRRGAAVYDQNYHLGVNIIRGENGSGKSTIADFIFYILGGEFENWKTAAEACDQVQAEVVTQGGVLVLRRDIGKAQTPIGVFFGRMDEAERHGLDRWETYAIRRTGSGLSFTQTMFRAAGIPEAQSQGASNITMHQILRLLYSDQRTPAAFLFRYENFDPREIREAVGDLICGLSVYELYEIELMLRDLGRDFDEKSRRLTALLTALPKEETIARVEIIDTRLTELAAEYKRLADEIENVDELVDHGQVQEFVRARGKVVEEVRKLRAEINSNEQRIQVTELEINDLHRFVEYLEELTEKLPKAQAASDIIGNIEFTYCPACLTPLSDDKGVGHCVVCGAATDPEQERSRYLQIKTDLEIQIKEARQLLDEKEYAAIQIDRDLRVARREHQDKLSEYTVKYDISTSPRESFVAERYQRIGQIDRERTELSRLRERVLIIEKLSAEKAELQDQISRLKDRLDALNLPGRRRKAQALSLVSHIARSILRQDLERQEEFRNAQSVLLNFADNSVQVDGELNFAESSNVIVKNTAILSMLLGATEDTQFHHPRFALLDNVEDKGMELERSHNFQEIILRASIAAKLEHQIIYTASMLNPELDDDQYVIGPQYTHERRTLNLRNVP
jgi:AAA domain